MLDPILTSMRVTIAIMGTILFLALFADLERHHRAFCAIHQDDKSCVDTGPSAPTSYE